MISISTKYALAALSHLGGAEHPEFVSIQVLSEELKIPRSYLAKIMKTLANRELIESKKGLNGGFRLISDRGTISLFDLCVALDDPVIKETCFLSRSKCSEAGTCQFHFPWKEMKAQIRNFLTQFTVA